MVKRKRPTEEIDLAHDGKTKKAKGQEQDKTMSENLEVPHTKEKGMIHPEMTQPQTSEDQNAIALKLAKRERRRLKKEQQGPQEQIERKFQTGESKEASPTIVQNSKNRKKKDGQKRKKRQSDDPAWALSNPIGGRLLDCDPIFSLDENHIFLAYESAIVVYSTETSLPVRSLRLNAKISAFALSSLQESQLYVSTFSGMIEEWDWTRGSRTGHWKLSSSIYALSTSARVPGEEMRDVVYTIDRKGSDPWLISAHTLAQTGASLKTEVKTLSTSREALSSMKSLEGGRYIVATSAAQLIIGICKSTSPVRLQDLSYTWRVVECPEWIVSLDVRVSQQNKDKDSRSSKREKERTHCLDIALGGLKGSIHVYENLLGNLIRKEHLKGKEGSEGIKSRRLHWHRNAVLSLKWSLDGSSTNIARSLNRMLIFQVTILFPAVKKQC